MSVKKQLSPAKRPTQLGDDRESDLMFAKELKAPLRRGKHKPVTKVRLIIERAIDQATIGNFHAMENLVRVWPVLKDVIATRSATRANNSTVDYARMSLQEAQACYDEIVRKSKSSGVDEAGTDANIDLMLADELRKIVKTRAGTSMMKHGLIIKLAINLAMMGNLKPLRILITLRELLNAAMNAARKRSRRDEWAKIDFSELSIKESQDIYRKMIRESEPLR